MICLIGFSFYATSSLEKIGLFPTISFEEVNLYLGDITVYLGEIGPPSRKIGLSRETCLSLTFFLGEVKLSAIFSLEEKNLPLEEVKFSLVNIILYLGEMGPPFGKIGLSGETCLSPAFFLGQLTFPIDLSFRGVTLPLGEKDFFLEEHSLNLHASFSLGEMILPHGGVGFSTTFSLGGTNSFSREFVLHFGEGFFFLENWLCCSVPYCIPTEFLLKEGPVQTTAHSFFQPIHTN